MLTRLWCAYCGVQYVALFIPRVIFSSGLQRGSETQSLGENAFWSFICIPGDLASAISCLA